MEAHIENAYIAELINQCEGAIAAAQRTNESLQRDRPVVVFYHLQAFINHAGAVSRILWPPWIRDANRAAAARARAEHLRRELAVANDNALENRTLRNHIEHFDERLDEWASSSTSFNFIDLNIMPRTAIQGPADTDVFRLFDPNTSKFYFRGETFDVQALATSIESIRNSAQARANALEEIRRAKFTPA